MDKSVLSVDIRSVVVSARTGKSGDFVLNRKICARVGTRGYLAYKEAVCNYRVIAELARDTARLSVTVF